MFDFVRFAGAGQQVGDLDGQTTLVGEVLEFCFPERDC
jgi:hypothetical protein